MENNKPITENELMHKLVVAKKIMNKVDSGNFERKKEQSYDDYDNNAIDNDYLNEYSQPQNLTPPPLVNEERILNSKLPKEIKDLMINNPIIQPQVKTDNMGMFEGAKKLMEREGLTKSKKPLNENVSNTDYKKLANLIENIVRKVLDEKLNELTNVKGIAINENLAIKVGDSIFSGKITKVTNKNNS
jgi:hypothetical protein